MALKNVSNDEAPKMLEDIICSSEFSRGIQNQLICFATINVLLSITSILGNGLILIALRKESSMHHSSKLLFRSLAIADFCVGVLAEPLIVTAYFSMLSGRWDVCRYSNFAIMVAGYILCSVSISTMTAISVDRLLALSCGLRYRQIVTTRRICVQIAVSWVLPVVAVILYFVNYLITLWYAYIGIPLTLAVSLFCYMRIFSLLRRTQAQVQNDENRSRCHQTLPLNIARYKKTVSTTLFVQLALIICYLPYGVVEAFNAQSGLNTSVFLARESTVALVFLNSSLNPILYYWRMREVKLAVKNIVRSCVCLSD